MFSVYILSFNSIVVQTLVIILKCPLLHASACGGVGLSVDVYIVRVLSAPCAEFLDLAAFVSFQCSNPDVLNIYRRYYTAVRRYEFYLRVVKTI